MPLEESSTSKNQGVVALIMAVLVLFGLSVGVDAFNQVTTMEQTLGEQSKLCLV